MAKRKHVYRIVAVLALTFGLGGCTPDLIEVDAINMVLALGVDQVEGKVLVSAEIVLAQGAQGGVQQKQQSQYMVKESMGDSIESAIDKLNQNLPRRTFLPHNTVVVFGKSYAEQGLSRAFDYFERDRAYRRNQVWLVTPQQASTMLKESTNPESINALGLRQLVEQYSDSSRLLNSQQLRVMREYLQASNSPVLTAVDLGSDGKPVIAGVGVFNRGKLITFLNPVETVGLILHTGTTRGTIVDVPCPSAGVDVQSTFRLLTTRTDVQPTVKNGTVSLHYKVRGRAEVIRVCPGEKVDAKTLEKLEQAIDKEIANRMRETMTKLQENHVDGVQAGSRLFQVAPTPWRKLAPNWNASFANAKTSYDVKIHLIRSGLSASEPSADYSREQFPPKSGKEPKVK